MLDWFGTPFTEALEAYIRDCQLDVLREQLGSGATDVAKVVPDILKTMSLRPDFLAAVDAASNLHFTDGALTRAQHEMIASYVSALNRCRY